MRRLSYSFPPFLLILCFVVLNIPSDAPDRVGVVYVDAAKVATRRLLEEEVMAASDTKEVEEKDDINMEKDGTDDENDDQDDDNNGDDDGEAGPNTTEETDGDNEEEGSEEEDEEEEDDDQDEEEDEKDGFMHKVNARFKDMDREDDAGDDDTDLTNLHLPEENITIAPDIKISRGNITHPRIAWLMSFPNSGTSFTIHMTREASNTTTATNYAGEGEVKDLPSTPAIEGPIGEQGPFLELIRGRYTEIPNIILTKTHCTGFCSNCGPQKLLFETPRSFMRGCLSGTRAVVSNGRLKIIDTMYDPKLIAKAIHIFRHPLDNIVARFHLEYNEEAASGNHKYMKKYPRNATGFQRWCSRSDKTTDLFDTRYIDDSLKEKLARVPCFNEFFKYVQWHNMAFYTTHELNLDVLYLHYHEYDEDFEKARDKVLQFLELPLVGLGVEFHSGKVYRHYYTQENKIAIKAFIEEYASRDTWDKVKDYDFEIETDVTGKVSAAAATPATTATA